MGALVPAANVPALLAAFGGQSPVELVVGGQVVPANEHTALTLRRARPSRDPIGTPASCSGVVAVDTPPTWRKGDQLQVRMTQAALDAVYGQAVDTNHSKNPRSTPAYPSNNGPVYPATRVTGITGPNGTGLTTATKSTQAAGTPASPAFLSIYNVDGRANDVGAARWVGAWFYSSVAATASIYLSGTNPASKQDVDIPAATWRFIATKAKGTGYAIALLTKKGGNAAQGVDFGYVTGSVVRYDRAPGPADYFDGSFPASVKGQVVTTGMGPLGTPAANVVTGQAPGFAGFASWTRVTPGTAFYGVRSSGSTATPPRWSTPVQGHAWVGNDGAAPIVVRVDVNDDLDTMTEFTLAPGEARQLHVGPTGYQRDAAVTVHYIDVVLTTAAGSFLVAPVNDVGFRDIPWAEQVENITYGWTGAVDSSTSTATRPDVQAAQARARYRFTGRLTDLNLDARLGGPAMVSIIGTGRLAELGTMYVGDKPWPAEQATARAQRILDQAKLQAPDLAFQVNLADTFPVPARDVDRQPVQGLLEDLAPALGPRAGVNEWRDGTIQLDTGYTDTLPAVGLAGEAVQTPLAFAQADVVNDVTLDLGKPPTGFALYRNLTANPHAEVSLTNYAALGTTTALARDTTKGVYRLTSAKATASTAAAGFGIRHASIVGIGWAYGAQVVTHTVFAASSRAHTLRFNYRWMDGGVQVQAGSKDYAWPGDSKFYASTLTLEAPPAGGAGLHLELEVTTTDAAVVGDQLWLVAGCAQDISQPAPGIVSAYFDGSLADTLARDYAWDGPVGDGMSVVYAGAEPDAITVRQTDAASIADQGVHAVTIKQGVAWDSPEFAWGAFDPSAWFLTESSWGLPDLVVDVLPLLDGRVQAITTTPTGEELPAELAGRVLQAELGAMRGIRLPQGQPDHMPTVDTDAGGDGAITALTETITAHRWVVTTSAERTF